MDIDWSTFHSLDFDSLLEDDEPSNPQEEGASGRETGGSDTAPPDRPLQDPQPRAEPNAQEQQQQEPRGQDPPPNNNPPGPGQEWGGIIFPQNPPLNSVQSAAPRPHEEKVPRGVPRANPQGNYMPRYPNSAVQANRSDTFLHGWPAYLNQTPYEMSSPGFFYTVNCIMATEEVKNMAKKYVTTRMYGFTEDVEAVIKEFLLENGGKLPTSDEFGSTWATMRGTKGIVKLQEENEFRQKETMRLEKQMMRLENDFENEKKKSRLLQQKLNEESMLRSH